MKGKKKRNRKNFLLVVPAFLLLAGCGGDGGDAHTRGYKQIEPAQAASQAEAMEEKISGEGFKFPAKGTLRSVNNVVSETNAMNMEYKVVYDFDETNPYLYMTATFSGSTAEGSSIPTTTASTWVYMDKGVGYLLCDNDGSKTYVTVDVSELTKRIETGLDSCGMSKETLVQNNADFLETIGEAAKEAVNVGVSLSEGFSLDYRFLAKGEGDLALEAKQSLSKQGGSNSSSMSVDIVFKDYLLIYCEIDLEVTADKKSTSTYNLFEFEPDKAPYFYVNTVTESTTVSLWTYVDDGKCYMVADYGGNKSYAISEASDALESGENMFGYAGLTLQSIVNSAKQMASTIASFAKNVSADISMPDGVSLDYTFKANGAGDLSLDATTKTPSSDAYVGVVFKDYLLVYAETKATATIDSVTSSQYSLIEIDWNNAVHNLPDLSQYTLSSTGA